MSADGGDSGGSWSEAEPGRRGLSVAQLSDGESASFTCLGNPYREDTEESDGALHVPVSPSDVPDGMADMSGDDLEEGREYNIINSSTAFYLALCRALGIEAGERYGGTIEGSEMVVTAHQPDDGDRYSRDYSIDFS